jgi:hypothetical protein
MMLWAMGNLRIKDDDLLNVLYTLIQQKQSAFNLSQLGMVLQMHCQLKLW